VAEDLPPIYWQLTTGNWQLPLRIISGQFKSRLLLGPEDEKTTRPITDRVKQSLFDIVTPLLDGASVYDCFAGTGSMGLESLSRGARHATFFESDRSALARLRKNIAALGVQPQSTVIATDIFRHFAAAPPPPREQAANLIFLDPPYRFLHDRPADLTQLAVHLATHLAPEGRLIFRHDAKDTLALPNLQIEDTRTYGGMTLEIVWAR
jgi:16S rRNA (guanine966-N2)-methyltransferase